MRCAALRLALRAGLVWIVLAVLPASLAAFPDEPLLDDFDRPDQGPPPSAAWVNATGLPGQEGVVVRNSRAQGANTLHSHSSSWNTLFPADQEVFVSYAATPDTAAASGIGLRLQDPSDHLTPQYYTQWYARSGTADDEVTIWKRFTDSSGEFRDECVACFVDLGSDLGPGDQIGMRAVGSLVEAFLDGALVASFTDNDEPILAPGYINLYVGDAEGQVFDDFGGGGLVPECSDGLDNDGDGATDFPADPGCEGPDDDDETDPPPPSNFPVTPILDDFERPDGGPPPSAAWVNAAGLAGPGVSVASGRALATTPEDSNSSSWNTLLPASQEVHVAYAQTPAPGSSSGLSVRMQDPSDHLSDQYYTQWYARPGTGNDEVTIWKRFVDGNGIYRDQCRACFAPLGVDLVAGDRIGMRASGETVEAYHNGVLVASIRDGSEPIVSPGFINLYISDGSGDVFDDFGGGGLIPACSDGIDNDFDAAVDHPDDPDCDGPDDDREAPSDSDGDGIVDPQDNCLLEANPLQTDSDGDQCGNGCDADYDQNGLVGTADFNRFRLAFGSALSDPAYDPPVDFNADGVIGVPDFDFFRGSFGTPPGPSGTTASTLSCP